MWTNQHLIQLHHKAFVYEIVNLSTGERYIGKKNTFNRRFNKTTRQFEISESDWQNYQSSSLIASKWTDISKTILYACKTPAEANFIETSLLFKNDALNPNSPYVNKNISGRHYTYYKH